MGKLISKEDIPQLVELYDVDVCGTLTELVEWRDGEVSDIIYNTLDEVLDIIGQNFVQKEV